MSAYRRLDSTLPISEDVRPDLYPFRTTKDGQRTGTVAAIRAALGEEAFRHLRKAAPANIALPQTLKWSESLPPGVRPVALMHQFARIANLIAAVWGDLAQFDIYMESLLTDKRGGRKGFPDDVLAELTALDMHRHRVGDCASPWLSVGRRDQQ